MFTGSDQDLKPGSPCWQWGHKLVMDMAVAIKGILWDLWLQNTSTDTHTQSAQQCTDIESTQLTSNSNNSELSSRPKAL